MRQYRWDEDSTEHQRGSWRLYKTPEKAWHAMYEDCLKAKESIEFEQYILEDDPLGHKFLTLFTAKAEEGLRVRIICDGYGSRRLIDSDRITALRRNGGKLHFYHPLRRWDIFFPWRWFPRTHTKTLLIDSRIAYTGGVCMSWRMRHWRDMHIRITGPVIHQIRQAFDTTERGVFGRMRSTAVNPEFTEHGFRYVEHQPGLRFNPLYSAFLNTLENSRDSIRIASAFFIPSRALMKALSQAARRGVDVKLMVSQTSDVPLADWVCLSYARELLHAGVRIFLYQPTVLHSKTILIDNNWVSIGSMNMDFLSFFQNREANLIALDAEFADELRQQFQEDLEYCVEVTEEYLKAIPWWKRKAAYLARVFKRFF